MSADNAAAGDSKGPDYIQTLKDDLLKLGRMVELSISRSVRALQHRDKTLARGVVHDDERIDHAEVELEKLCIHILESHHPMGRDLRFVVAVLKINDSLERIGDLAENVAQAVIGSGNWDGFDEVKGYEKLAELAQLMLQRSLEAFVDQDVRVAYRVIKDDNQVDTLRQNMGRAIESAVDINQGYGSGLLRLEFVSRQFERIADYTTNIAEEVIYMIDGKIIRHPSRFRNADNVISNASGTFRRVQ